MSVDALRKDCAAACRTSRSGFVECMMCRLSGTKGVGGSLEFAIIHKFIRDFKAALYSTDQCSAQHQAEAKEN